MAWKFAPVEFNSYLCSIKPSRSDGSTDSPFPRCGWVHLHFGKSVYSTLILDVMKPGKFQSKSRMMQTVDALWICYIAAVGDARASASVVYLHILREASAFARSILMGNSRAS